MLFIYTLCDIKYKEPEVLLFMQISGSVLKIQIFLQFISKQSNMYTINKGMVRLN